MSTKTYFETPELEVYDYSDILTTSPTDTEEVDIECPEDNLW